MKIDSFSVIYVPMSDMLFKEFCAAVVQSCPDMSFFLQRLDVTDITDRERVFKAILHEYIAIKGHVQSGKTNVMIGLAMIALWFKWSMVIVVRNLQSDMDQFMTRLQDAKAAFLPFLKQIRIVKSSTHTISPRTTECIYVCLGNNKSIAKVNHLLTDQSYMACIDEVDALDMGKQTKRNEAFVLLKQHAKCVMGISATVMDPLGKETIRSSHLMVLHTASNYKGLYDITFCPLEGKSTFCGRVTDDLVEHHEPLLPFLHAFASRPPLRDCTRHFPHIGLVNIGSTVAPYEALQQRMMKEYPTITTMVYNAKGVTMAYEGKLEKRSDSIAECLQWCKEEGGVTRFPYILIFSGQLAGRGISFTDTDYEWHLTVMYLIVSKTCDEMELIQKIRLCGRYADSFPLELYTTPAIYSDLIKAYCRQEEIVVSLATQPSVVCKEQLGEMTLFHDKFTKRAIMKQGKCTVQASDVVSPTEWSVDVYEGVQYPPTDAFRLYGTDRPAQECPIGHSLKTSPKVLDDMELKRLRDKMFRIWSKDIGKTKISVWLDELDPVKLYTKSEMHDMLKRHSISLQHVMVGTFEKSGSRGYGTLLCVDKGHYKLYEELIDAHHMYFSQNK
jgi:hypothetical protein